MLAAKKLRLALNVLRFWNINAVFQSSLYPKCNTLNLEIQFLICSSNFAFGAENELYKYYPRQLCKKQNSSSLACIVSQRTLRTGHRPSGTLAENQKSFSSFCIFFFAIIIRFIPATCQPRLAYRNNLVVSTRYRLKTCSTTDS